MKIKRIAKKIFDEQRQLFEKICRKFKNEQNLINQMCLNTFR